MPETLTEQLNWGLASHGVDLYIDTAHYPAGLAAVDVETDEQDHFVGLALTDGPAVYYYTKLTDELKRMLEDIDLIGHNIKSDAKWLRQWGVNLNLDDLVYDTMLASYVQDSTKQGHGLKDLTKEVLNWEYPSYKDMVGTGKSKQTLDKQPVEKVANYCGMDALSTFKLYQYFTKVLTKEQDRYLRDIEMPVMRVLTLMEEQGVMLDAGYLTTLDSRFNMEVRHLVERIKLLAPSIKNVNSDKQVGDFLVSKGITLPKTPKGKNSVSGKALEPYQGIPFVKALRRYSEMEKLVSTYTQPLLERTNESNNRLYASFNQAITHTGRLSSSGPNLQNIPTRTNTGNLLRGVFIASSEHIFIDADYSQIEPRLFAHFSQDPELLKIFNSGLDLYDYVAESIGSTRSVAKTVWLALSYNAGAFKIGQTAHIATYTAQEFIDKMRQKFGVAFAWKEKVIRDTDSNKYIETLLGRRIKLIEPGLGPNYTVQGSAAEIMKLAIIKTQDFNPVLTVHDELLFEIDYFAEFPYSSVDSIKTRMESVYQLRVPLIAEVGVGRTWSEAKQ